MLTMSLIIAFLLDRVSPDLRNLRKRGMLQGYYHWLITRFALEASPSWVIPLVLILPLVILFSLVENLVGAVLWDLFELCFYVVVAYLCIDSSLLFERVDDCLKSNQQDAGSLAQSLNAEANSALFSAVFWMITGGPMVLVFYRLVEKLPASPDLPSRAQWTGYVETMTAWLEWIPSILTSFGYMICGNFDAAWNRFKPLALVDDDMSQLNRTRLQEVALASVNAQELDDDIELLKRLRGLSLRALMLWILIAALFETLV